MNSTKLFRFAFHYKFLCALLALAASSAAISDATVYTSEQMMERLLQIAEAREPPRASQIASEFGVEFKETLGANWAKQWLSGAGRYPLSNDPIRQVYYMEGKSGGVTIGLPFAAPRIGGARTRERFCIDKNALSSRLVPRWKMETRTALDLQENYRVSIGDWERIISISPLSQELETCVSSFAIVFNPLKSPR